MRLKIFIGFAVLFLAQVVVADELHVIINGKAYHFDRSKDWNENNYGLGFEYDFRPRGNWIPLVTGGVFKDSNNQTSNYLGGGAKYRYLLGKDPAGLHFDVGVIGFLMTRKDFKNEEPFPGVLPFVSLGNEHVAINATFIPKVDPKMTNLLYFQLTIRVAEFD